MNLTRILTAQQIVHKAGMSDRPEFYSGRGATTDDLNHNHLETIYQAIKVNHGEPAAEQYVQMVATIPKLTATDFLLSLYQLERNEWKVPETMNKATQQEKVAGIYIGSDRGDGTREGAASGAVFSVLSGMSNNDQTPTIRNYFLRSHGIEVEQKNEYFW